MASFFVSRVDTETDRRIDAKGGPCSISGARSPSPTRSWPTSGFANRCGAPRWQRLASAGARPQRLLWASTGTKNPAYSDVLYVDSLIGPDTINTMPPATLQLFEDHGTVARTLPEDASEAASLMDRLAAGGIDFADVTRALEDDGIEKFAKSFETLLGVIGSKRKALVAQAPPRHSAVFRAVDAAVAVRLDASDAAQLPKRIWARDPTVWKDDPDTPEIRDRLGWLTVGKAMAQQVKALTAFADEVRAEFSRVVLCGMGGSSLAPEVLWRTFGAAPGHPSLHVLDSTDPRAVRQAEQGAIWRRPCSSSRASREPRRRATASSAISGSAPAAGDRSSSRSPTPARRSSSSPASAGSAGPSSIRPTSAAATRRCRSSAWCRRR